MPQLETSEQSDFRGLNRVVSSVKQGKFDGAILCFKENNLGSSVFADGFGPNGEEMMKRIGKLLSIVPTEGRPMYEPKSEGRNKSFNPKGEKERTLEKLEKIKSQPRKDQYAVFWMEKDGSETRVGLEGVGGSSLKLFRNLRSALKIQTNSSKSPVKSQGPQHHDGEVLDFDDVVGLEEVKETFEA